MKTIPGHPGYEVSENGQIWSGRFQRFLKPGKNSSGYLTVALCGNGECHTKAVHVLVAEAYIPNPDNKPEVNHKDSDRTNPHYKNLEWATHKENVQHSFTQGNKSHKGEDNPISKLTAEDVLEIRRRLADGETGKDLAVVFGIGTTAISRIKTRRAWGHI